MGASTASVIDGIVLSVLGMGTVFVFLALLVVTTSLMSRLVRRYAPAPPAATSCSGAPPDGAIVAAIAAAIHAHRTRRSD